MRAVGGCTVVWGGGVRMVRGCCVVWGGGEGSWGGVPVG